MFVWVKNTQMFWIFSLIQSFTLVTNMESILRLRQRFWSNSIFHFSSRILLIYFHVYFIFLLTRRNFHQESPNLCSDENKNIGQKSTTILLLTGRCGAKLILNEKWLPFGGRWMDSKSKFIFEFSEKNWIRWVVPSFWVFLSRTKVSFVNRGYMYKNQIHISVHGQSSSQT